MISMDKNGGRTIHLFVPFEYKGRKIESITLSPVRFGHLLRWNEGDWKEVMAFLVELAGVDDAVIRELRYPDADRVMEAFMAMVPPAIRDDVMSGRVPQKLAQAAPEVAPTPTNGGGQPLLGPGAPLPPAPQVGFDMSDDPPEVP